MLIGVDIGTQVARAAALDADGRARLIPDGYGTPCIPAAVRYTMRGPLAGADAERALVSGWEVTVRGLPRLLARYADLPQQELRATPFRIHDLDGQTRLDLLYADVGPEEAYADLLAALVQQAEQYLHAPVDEVVLTVPASAEDRYRVLVRQAAESLGLRVRRLINQPTAVILGLQSVGAAAPAGNQSAAPSGLVAIVDAGAGTTDVSIADIHAGQIRILATAGDAYLGLRDLALRVAEGLNRRLRPQAGRDLLAALTGPGAGESKVAALGLIRAAEEALTTLALAPQAVVALDHGAGFGRDLYLRVSRAEADSWMQPEIARIAALCARALTAAGLAAPQCAEVVLVGGAAAIPAVRRAVAAAFKRPPATLRLPDPLAPAALGAALAGRDAGAAIWDVTPFPLGINCYYGEEELFSPIIAANTPIPTPGIGAAGAMRDSFTTRFPDQTSVRLNVLQYRGARRPATAGPNKVYPHECELLGSWLFEGLHPPPGGHAPFTVTFVVDADGILHLLAEETATGHRIGGTVRRV